MRVALISDIHGNALALDAVLDDIDQRGVDRLVCLGDNATLGPEPVATLERIEDLGCPCIMGNHDAFLLDPSLVSQHSRSPVVTGGVAWANDQVSDRHRDVVRTYVDTLLLELCPGVALSLYHGSPLSFFDNILAETPADELDAYLAGQSAEVLAGGHTHVQMLRQHRGQLVVNVGSVGMPFEAFVSNQAPMVLPHAEYAIVEATPAAGVTIELHRLPLDVAALAARTKPAADAGNPACADLLARCYR